MKTIAVFIVALILAGCVSVKYDRTGGPDSGEEHLSVTTWFKSLDGLYADRGSDGFEIIIDKTYSEDPFEAIAVLLDQIAELQGMGLRYDPDWRSPLDPNKEP